MPEHSSISDTGWSWWVGDSPSHLRQNDIHEHDIKGRGVDFRNRRLRVCNLIYFATDKLQEANGEVSSASQTLMSMALLLPRPDLRNSVILDHQDSWRFSPREGRRPVAHCITLCRTDFFRRRDHHLHRFIADVHLMHLHDLPVVLIVACRYVGILAD